MNIIKVFAAVSILIEYVWTKKRDRKWANNSFTFMAHIHNINHKLGLYNNYTWQY